MQYKMRKTREIPNTNLSHIGSTDNVNAYIYVYIVIPTTHTVNEYQQKDIEKIQIRNF